MATDLYRIALNYFIHKNLEGILGPVIVSCLIAGQKFIVGLGNNAVCIKEAAFLSKMAATYLGDFASHTSHCVKVLLV